MDRFAGGHTPKEPNIVGSCAGKGCGGDIYDYELIKCTSCDAEVHIGCIEECESCGESGCRSCFNENKEVGGWYCDECAGKEIEGETCD